MWLNIWITTACIVYKEVLCMYEGEFIDDPFSPATVIYHHVPFKKYPPLWEKELLQSDDDRIKALSSESLESYTKFPLDNPPELLPLEQGVVHYRLEPTKQQLNSNTKVYNGAQVNLFDRNNAIDSVHTASTDSPIETEIYHVQLPPVIVDHTGRYHRVPTEVVKGLQAGSRLQPGVVHYPHSTIHTQFPAQQVRNGQNYLHQRAPLNQLRKQPEQATPVIHYHSHPHSNSYLPGQSYYPVRNERVVRYPSYTTASDYLSYLPPRSAAKPLLAKSDNSTANATESFSQRDDGFFGSLRGLQQPAHSPPQGRSDFPNRQRLYDDSPVLFNSPVYKLNRSNGTPKCANGTNVTFCLVDEEYPSEIVRLSMNNNQFLLERILADPSDSSTIKLVEGVETSNVSSNRQVEQENDNITRAEDSSYICPSKVTYSKPLRAANIDGEWKVVVNLKKTNVGAKYTQTVRLEECTRPDVPCNFLNGAINSKCIQKYNLQRLLVWSYEEGIHFDVFRLPIACSCQIRHPSNKVQ